jgi:AraC-like DNA-binding protein
MTYIVPNYFLEEQPNAVISSDALFTLAYSSRKNQDKISIRNTTNLMILLTSGKKRLTTHDDEIMLHEGDILFLTQGNYFMSEIVNDQGVYEAMMVYFDDGFVMDFIAKYVVELRQSSEKSVVSFSSDKLLKSLIDSFGLYINQDLKRQNEIVKLKTEEIFLHLLSQNPKDFAGFLKGISSSSKERVRHILEANLDLITSVENMCKIARVSKNELRVAMKNSFDMKPKEWLDSRRLEQASLLLKNTDETIASIATTCGYSTLSWFGVQFKKVYGVTPKRYREQNQ